MPAVSTSRSNSSRTKLSAYRTMRNFSKTGEPSGERFVVQKHAATRLHYDLRLELDDVFKSWTVTRGPSLDPKDKRLAVEVEDHPLDQGDFEGINPKGEYGGGTVQLWDRGYWVPEGDASPRAALAAGELKFLLAGERLNGGWVLVRMKLDRNGGKRSNWLLIKHRDDYAADQAAVATLYAEDRSVASERPMASIAAGKGASPKAFMLEGGTAADAVWHTKQPAGKDDPKTNTVSAKTVKHPSRKTAGTQRSRRRRRRFPRSSTRSYAKAYRVLRTTRIGRMKSNWTATGSRLICSPARPPCTPARDSTGRNASAPRSPGRSVACPMASMTKRSSHSTPKANRDFLRCRAH